MSTVYCIFKGTVNENMSTVYCNFKGTINENMSTVYSKFKGTVHNKGTSRLYVKCHIHHGTFFFWKSV